MKLCGSFEKNTLNYEEVKKDDEGEKREAVMKPKAERIRKPVARLQFRSPKHPEVFIAIAKVSTWTTHGPYTPAMLLAYVSPCSSSSPSQTLHFGMT